MTDELRDLLDDLDEYLDARADAEYFTDSPAPHPNEEMRLLTRLRALPRSGGEVESTKDADAVRVVLASSLERVADALEVANAISVGHTRGCASEHARGTPTPQCNCGYSAAKRVARAALASTAESE